MSDLVPKSPTEGLSPNAKSFQRYNDIPVSLYTGTPDISIPLATVRDGSLTLPINLSYHCRGVKPDEHPGWTGLGWTLMLGGAITRSKNDIPDETESVDLKTGFLYAYNIIKDLDKDPLRVEHLMNEYRSNSFFLYDHQPDKFSFNFMGYSGFFMMNNDGEWEVCCDHPIKVENYSVIRPYELNSKLFSTECGKILSSFTLVDEYDVRYTFGGKHSDEFAFDMSINIRQQNSSKWESTAWYLTEISHPNGQNMTFRYEHRDFTASLSYREYSAYMADANGNTVAYFFPEEKQGVLIYPVYLKSVKGNTFHIGLDISETQELGYGGTEYASRMRIDFDDPNCRPIYFDKPTFSEKTIWYQLDAIHIYDMSLKSETFAPIKKHIKFSYTDSKSSRLMLNNIKFSGTDNIAEETYTFTYHRPDLLPPYLSEQTDHWGYYNGVDNDFNDPMATMAANPKTLTLGSLYEIIYPTGGKSVFEFEPHSYARISNVNTCGDIVEQDSTDYAGGIRIKRIVNVSNDNSEPAIKEYHYVMNFKPGIDGLKSSGILECPPIHRNVAEYSNGFSFIEQCRQPLSNVINNFGQHIGYQEVAETDGSEGYIISRFTCSADPGYKDMNPIWRSTDSKFVPISGKAGDRGRLMTETFFNSDGKLLKEKTINYRVLNDYETYIYSLYHSDVSMKYADAYLHNISHSNLTFSVYKNYVYSLRESSISEYVYGSNSTHPLETTHYFEYNNQGQICTDSLVSKRLRHNVSDVTKISYEWEHDSGFEHKHNLAAKHSVASFHNGKLTSKAHNTYGLTGLRGDLPYISSVVQTELSGVSKITYECLEADNRGNPMLIRTADNIMIAYVWGADGQYPITEIRLPSGEYYSKLKNLELELPVNPQETLTFADRIRSELPEAMVTGYTYLPLLGITAISDPSGKRSTYEYDSFGRLIKIIDCDGNLIEEYEYSTATSDRK
ncbi:MAG: hypothetical protein NC111_01810 [Bacteroides sp.]|nr:hypothetical protein [Bacteroides sp.]MCM1471252.1 hypothetical protein [Bacteroides sp.]